MTLPLWSIVAAVESFAILSLLLFYRSQKWKRAALQEKRTSARWLAMSRDWQRLYYQGKRLSASDEEKLKILG